MSLLTLSSARAGLLQEGEHVAALNSELQAAEATCSALPAELQHMKDSLDRDTSDLRRREAGERRPRSPFISVRLRFISQQTL